MMMNMDIVGIRMEALRIANGHATLVSSPSRDLLGRAEAIYQFIIGGQIATPDDTKPDCDAVEVDDVSWLGDNVRRSYAILNSKGELIDSFYRENDLSVAGAANAFEWRADASGAPYKVYLFDAHTGFSGCIGTTDLCSFVDEGLHAVGGSDRLDADTIAAAEIGGPFTPF